MQQPQATMRSKGRVTIPAEVREHVHIDEGTVVEFAVTDEGLLLRPKLTVDATQAWFWTPRWQQMEKEADADIAAGGSETYSSVAEFKAALDGQGRDSK